MHVTQSTVSARIQNLEQGLGARLFVRNRSGASLTPAGQRFLRHAKTLLLTFEQACHDVGLPSRFRASLTIGARIALWDAFLPRWAGRLRAAAPDISLNTEIGFEEDLMRRIIAGTMDLALMYSPQQGAGIQVEHLFDETLILVGDAPDRSPPDDSYVYVDWGPTFYAQHRKVYPDLERPVGIELGAGAAQTRQPNHRLGPNGQFGSAREGQEVEAPCCDVLAHAARLDREAARNQFVEEFALYQVHLPQIRPGRMASDMEAVPVGDPAMRITLDPKPRQQTDARPGLLGNAMARVRGNRNDDRVHSVQPRVTHGTPAPRCYEAGGTASTVIPGSSATPADKLVSIAFGRDNRT